MNIDECVIFLLDKAIEEKDNRQKYIDICKYLLSTKYNGFGTTTPFDSKRPIPDWVIGSPQSNPCDNATTGTNIINTSAKIVADDVGSRDDKNAANTSMDVFKQNTEKGSEDDGIYY